MAKVAEKKEVKSRLAYGNVNLEFHPGRHFYTADGQPLIGVTTILGVISKEFLTAWASKEAVKFLGYYDRETWTPTGYIPAPEQDKIDGLDKLENALLKMQGMDAETYWKLLKEAKGAHTRKKKDAADIGTNVHAFIEAYIKGEKPEKPTESRELAGVDAFLRWVDGNTVEFVSSEHMVYSKEHGYAGTLDWTAKVNGRYMLGDTKTSSMIDGGMGYQLALYRNADVEESGHDPYQGQIIVNCRKTGELEVREFSEYQEDLKAALACIPLFRRQKVLKEREKNLQ